MIVLDNISKSFGTRVLFELEGNISFTEGKRYALTGPNGAGKSTLLKVIAGIEEPSSGTVTRPKRLSMLKQDIEAFENDKVLDVVIMGNERLWKAISERDKLYEEEITDEVGMRLGDLEEIIADEDGYSADSNAEILLEGMGIPAEVHEHTMSSIPTDWQFRVLLCQALFGEPQALLLDEPTNHMDLESIGWLEDFLHNYTGTLIVVSHDRHFLNAVATDVADIDYDTIITYPGNYDEMVMIKTATRSRAENEAKSKEKKVAKLKEFVSKFGAGSRASQVQSRRREIEKLQPQDLKQSNIQRPYIRFTRTEKAPGKVILKGEHLSKGYETTPNVIKDFSIEVARGDKIAVIGSNGSGKTTLLKLLAEAHAPDAGTIQPGHQVALSYFPQNHNDAIDKSEDANLFEWLRVRKKDAYDQDIRSVLGKMLFGGDDAFKKLKDLSGGETARLLLAEMMMNERNLIILDEPNNHLDLEAVSALAWGLKEFKETVIVASHDRDLISTVATKIIALEEDGIHTFEGSLDEYLSAKAKV